MRYRIIENGFPAYLGVMWFRRFLVIPSYLGGLNESECNPWVHEARIPTESVNSVGTLYGGIFSFPPCFFFLDRHGVTRARDRDSPEIRERVSSLLCLF